MTVEELREALALAGRQHWGVLEPVYAAARERLEQLERGAIAILPDADTIKRLATMVFSAPSSEEWQRTAAVLTALCLCHAQPRGGE